MCLPLAGGLALLVLFDVMAAAFFAVSYFDAKEASSEGYRELEHTLGVIAGVLTLAALVAVLGATEKLMLPGSSFMFAYLCTNILKLLACAVVLIVVAALRQDICWEAKAATWTFGYSYERLWDCDLVVFLFALQILAVALASSYGINLTRVIITETADEGDAEHRAPLLHDEHGVGHPAHPAVAAQPSRIQIETVQSKAEKMLPPFLKPKHSGLPDDRYRYHQHGYHPSLSPRARASHDLYETRDAALDGGDPGQ